MSILNISSAALSSANIGRGLLTFTIASGVLWFIGSYILDKIRVKSLIRNLPTLGRGHWFSGNLLELFDIGNIGFHSEAKKRYGGALVIHGILGDEQIYFSDPLAMHHLLIKEMNNFLKPHATNATNSVVLGEGLLTSKGTQHKKQRKILNPVFHIKHMRGLIPIFCRVTSKVTDALTHKLTIGPPVQEINMFDWLSRLALELVGQAGIGYSFDTLAEGEKCEYTAVVKDLMPTLAALHIPLLTLPPLARHLPASLKTWMSKHLPTKPMRTLRSIVEVMFRTSNDALQQKKLEIAATEGIVLEEKGHDLLAIILKANARESESDRLSDNEVIGQINTVIFAAQDTTSSALSRTIHTLAIHQAAQARLRAEIRNARLAKVEGEPWSYDELNELPYLDAVCRETLRIYAPVWRIARTASEATTIPLLRPITGTDGELITHVPIAKGQTVFIAIAAANRDEAVWGADAHEWNPDRWLNKAKYGDWRDIFEAKEDWDIDGSGLGVKERRYPGVYSGMMSFSGGGRACIGFKFSLLEMKVVLAMLIEKFAFAIPPNRDIVWCATNIQTPSLRGMERETPRMPMLVSLA